MFGISIAKAGETVTVDFDALPEVSQKYVIEYGLRQSLNDATASLKRDEYKSDEEFKAAALAVARKKLDAIESGELRQSAGRIGDPVEAEYMRLAVAAISTAIINKGGKLKEYTMKQLRERAAGLAEKNPDVAKRLRAKAEATVAEKAELAADIEV